MEDLLCAFTHSVTVRGQGCLVVLLLSLSALWTIADCQTHADNLAESATTFTQPVQSSYSASFTASSRDPFSSSSFSPTGSEGSVLSRTSAVVGLETSEFLQSSFSAYSTPAASVLRDSSGSSYASAEAASGFGSETTFTNAQWGDNDVNLPPLSTLETTVFLDSVAISKRLDLADFMVSSVASQFSPSSTVVNHGSASLGAPVLDGYASTVAATSTHALEPSETTWSVSETGTVSVVSATASQSVVVESTPAQIPVPTPSTPSTMFGSNSTQPTTAHEQEVGETTASGAWSSPAPGGGNSSCAEKESGCVQFRGDEDDGGDVRVKVIIGVTCSAVVLFIIAGLLFGCMRRQRGKMPSGSKIDLSSYWDDSVTLSYINGHIDIPRDSTDEMISLDNDSFLNSLDSMSFTNTWNSDSSKRTNF